MESTLYLVNPDVVLREEDEDGGLLFNPDTNQVKIINATGLFIWKHFSGANKIETVLEAIRSNFEGVPADEVAGDLNEFLQGMVENGFIGKVEK